MKKSNVRQVIRQIVREEVAMAIQEVITEIKQPSQQVSQPQPQKKIVERKQFSSNSIINDVLNETAESKVEWEQMGGGTFDSSRMNEVMASQYGNMMNNSQPNVVVDGVSGDEPGMDFLKKDYREVLKKSEEKSKQKRGV